MAECAGVPIGIAATVCYIPRIRMEVERAEMPFASGVTAPSATLMASVYADTLRWRAAGSATGGTRQKATSAPGARLSQTVAVETQLDVSDMAVLVARRLRADSAPGIPAGPDQFVVCHSSFEYALTLSCACRLHSEFGTVKPPLAIGQLQGASFLMALLAVQAMMHRDAQLRAVMIVAAERWRPPFPRTTGSSVALGDGAAAVLVRRNLRRGWQVEALTVRTAASGAFNRGGHAGVDAGAIEQVIDETCAQAGLDPRDVDWVLPASIDEMLTREISVRCGLPVERTWNAQPPGYGYLCTADTPAQLDSLLRATAPQPGQRMLVWSAGLEGQAACAVLRYVTESQSTTPP